MAERQIYWMAGSDLKGPFSPEQIAELVNNGTLDSRSMVRLGADGKVVPAGMLIRRFVESELPRRPK